MSATTETTETRTETAAEILSHVASMLADSNQPDTVDCDVCIAAVWNRLEDLARALGDPETIMTVADYHEHWDWMGGWHDYHEGRLLRRVTQDGTVIDPDELDTV